MKFVIALKANNEDKKNGGVKVNAKQPVISSSTGSSTVNSIGSPVGNSIRNSVGNSTRNSVANPVMNSVGSSTVNSIGNPVGSAAVRPAMSSLVNRSANVGSVGGYCYPKPEEIQAKVRALTDQAEQELCKKQVNDLKAKRKVK